MSNPIIAEKLSREFTAKTGGLHSAKKKIFAVDEVSFSIEAGELFGLLGPNGAGKTTTVKMLTTLLLPTSGSASVLGFDIVRNPKPVRGLIGFVFGGERGLYWRLSGYDNLRYFATLYLVDPAVSKKRIPYLLDLVGLKDRANEKVEGYSRGMKQRLHIARTLIHDPKILFLDEPTIGLDPVGARELRKTICNLQAEKKTILLTTHYMFEADELCDRVAIINKGKIIAVDTPKELKKLVNDMSVVEIEVFGLPEVHIRHLQNLEFVDMVTVENRDQRQTLLVHTERGSEAIPDLLKTLQATRVGKVLVREPTLEDAYVRLVGEHSKPLET